MLAFLLPLASKIISDAVSKIPENEELGEKLIEICLLILGKAVNYLKLFLQQSGQEKLNNINICIKKL